MAQSFDAKNSRIFLTRRGPKFAYHSARARGPENEHARGQPDEWRDDEPRHSAACAGPALSIACVDLGMSPLCESFLDAEQIDMMEPFFPLHVLVCDDCFLVQLKEYVAAERHLHRIRLFLLLFDLLGRARAGAIAR